MTYEWPPLPVLDAAEAADLLAEAMREAWDDLEAERVAVMESLTLGRKDLVDAWIKEFQAAIDQFRRDVGYNVDRFLELHLVPRYQTGAESIGTGDLVWTTAHVQALTALAVDTYGDFLKRSQEAGRTAEAFARAVRKAARQELPKITAGGRTAAQAADRLEARLVSEYGIDHVVYRDGARVDVRVYAHMVARTKSAVAFNAGMLNETAAAGIKYVEVFDGGECGWTGHNDTDTASGSIRTVDEAAAWPIAHPNCQRAFGARPDITDDNRGTSKPSTTPEQRADQATVDYYQDGRNAARRPKLAARERTIARRRARQLGTSDPVEVGIILDQLRSQWGL